MYWLWVGVCRLILKTLTLFQTKIYNFPYPIFFAINDYGNTHYFKTGIPDQTDGIYTLFQTKIAKTIPYFRLEMLKNDTLWGGTYLYGLYMAVPPHPGLREGRATDQRYFTWSALCSLTYPECSVPFSVSCWIDFFSMKTLKTPRQVGDNTQYYD